MSLSIAELRSGRGIIAMLGLAMIAALINPSPAAAAPGQISYIIVPHPDDEYSQWSLVTGSLSNYKVIIVMTQGEETAACTKLADGGGYWYQGPGSLTSPPQPDYSEINPSGTGTNIWVGKWTSTCKAARRNAMRAWLDDKKASDASVPGGWSYRGLYTFDGQVSSGVNPQRQDAGGALYESRNAHVYDASNGMGKLIFFDLGDNDLTADEVRWAIAKVRSRKGDLGIPGYPEINAIGSYRNALYSSCDLYDHRDHKQVHVALFNYDMIAGKQHGRTCRYDVDVDPTRTKSISVSEHDVTKAMSGNFRIGPFQRRYGWLINGYWTAFDPDELFAREQHFWSRFN